MGFTWPLPIVEAQEPFEIWHHTVQPAIINSRGVFAIRDFSGDLTWETGSILSKKILRAYMRATMHSLLEIQPGLAFHKGEAGIESRLQDSNRIAMGRHVDKGLFNIVKVTGCYWSDLLIDMGDGDFMNPWNLTGLLGAQVLIVTPGYSLQAFEPKVVAPAYEFKPHGCPLNTTQIFQCRLAKNFEIKGQSIEVVLANHKRANQELTLVVDASALGIPWVDKRKKKCAVSENRPVVAATSEMSVGDLKVLLHDNEYMDPDLHCLHFDGRKVKDEVKCI